MPTSDAMPLSFFARPVLQRFLTLSLVAAVVLGLVVLLLYRQERSHERSLLEQQSTQRIEHEYELLTSEIEAIRSDVLYLAEQELLQQFLAGDEAARAQLAGEYVNFASRREVYDQIRFLDMDGKELVRVNFREGQAAIVPEEQLQLKSDRYYFREATKIDPGEVFVSEFDLNVEHGQIQQPLNPVLRFLTPVVDSTGEKRGLLALNYSGDHLLERFSDISLPGSTLLINSEGQYIYGLEPGDAWGWLLEHDRSFATHFTTAWERIQGESEGQFSTDEGLFTFQLVSLSAPPAGAATGEAEGATDPAPLVIVAYVPPELLHADSTKLLMQLMFMYLGAMALLTILGWYWAHAAAVRTLQARSIAESEGRLRTLSNQLLTAQEAERRSICRDLHDELGQLVTAIHLDLRSAAKQEDPARTQQFLSHASKESEQLLKSLHEIASRVRPSVLDDFGLQEALETAAAEIHRRSQVAVDMRFDFEESRLSPQVGENVYRIVQEALLNVVRHAKTEEASVEITLDHDDLCVRVEDHGAGFDPEKLDCSRLGMLSMRERAELLGGTFSVSSQPGAGTRIDIRVPLENGRA